MKNTESFGCVSSRKWFVHGILAISRNAICVIENVHFIRKYFLISVAGALAGETRDTSGCHVTRTTNVESPPNLATQRFNNTQILIFYKVCNI